MTGPRRTLPVRGIGEADELLALVVFQELDEGREALPTCSLRERELLDYRRLAPCRCRLRASGSTYARKGAPVCHALCRSSARNGDERGRAILRRRYRLRVGFPLDRPARRLALDDRARPRAQRGHAQSRSPTLLGRRSCSPPPRRYLTYYAASEDSYRRGGISRWEAYDAHVLTVGAILACLAVCALAVLADRRRGRSCWLAAPAGLAAAILFAVAFAAGTRSTSYYPSAEGCRGLASSPTRSGHLAHREQGPLDIRLGRSPRVMADGQALVG